VSCHGIASKIAVAVSVWSFEGTLASGPLLNRVSGPDANSVSLTVQMRPSKIDGKANLSVSEKADFVRENVNYAPKSDA
jgi:hypothetical protein